MFCSFCTNVHCVNIVNEHMNRAHEWLSVQHSQLLLPFACSFNTIFRMCTHTLCCCFIFSVVIFHLSFIFTSFFFSLVLLLASIMNRTFETITSLQHDEKCFLFFYVFSPSFSFYAEISSSSYLKWNRFVGLCKNTQSQWTP